jgi:hypothetical protein
MKRQLARLSPEREDVAIPPILEYLQSPEKDIHLQEKALVPDSYGK